MNILRGKRDRLEWRGNEGEGKAPAVGKAGSTRGWGRGEWREKMYRGERGRKRRGEIRDIKLILSK